MGIPRSKVRRVARLLNNDKRHGASARLSDWTGASIATVKGWQADEQAEHHRAMSRTARRLLAVLTYMHAENVLDERAMNNIKAIEAHLVAGKGRLDQFLEDLTGRRVCSEDDQE